MKQFFTLKSVLIALLAIMSCAMKAETVEYITDDGFVYSLDTESHEASLAKYWGNAAEVVIPVSVVSEGKEYKVTSLGEGCFAWCSSPVSVKIPSSVTSLGRCCFQGCSSLISIEISSPVTSLGDWCFYGCSSLTSIEIPSSVTSLGEYCFGDCSSLVSIELPSSVTSLGESCFSGCSSLTSIELPSSVTSLGDICFGDCRSLTSIVIPSSVTSLGRCCFGHCFSLTSIVIPSSVANLGDQCFQYCSSLQSIAIPSSVTSLGRECFSDCSSLTSVVIPSSVTSLGDFCFFGCSSLTTVICKMENVIADGYGTLFRDTPIESATLYVSEKMLDTYKSTYPWSYFGTILPWTEELEVGVDDTLELGITLKTANGNVMVSGLADGTQVSCYTIDGRMLGKSSADGGTATFTAEPNSIVIVKVGKKTFKVYVK